MFLEFYVNVNDLCIMYKYIRMDFFVLNKKKRMLNLYDLRYILNIIFDFLLFKCRIIIIYLYILY